MCSSSDPWCAYLGGNSRPSPTRLPPARIDRTYTHGLGRWPLFASTALHSMSRSSVPYLHGVFYHGTTDGNTVLTSPQGRGIICSANSLGLVGASVPHSWQQPGWTRRGRCCPTTMGDTTSIELGIDLKRKGPTNREIQSQRRPALRETHPSDFLADG